MCLKRAWMLHKGRLTLDSSHLSVALLSLVRSVETCSYWKLWSSNCFLSYEVPKSCFSTWWKALPMTHKGFTFLYVSFWQIRLDGHNGVSFWKQQIAGNTVFYYSDAPGGLHASAQSTTAVNRVGMIAGALITVWLCRFPWKSLLLIMS